MLHTSIVNYCFPHFALFLFTFVSFHKSTQHFSTAGIGTEIGHELMNGEDSRGHRLQRQDAKSRKTFKIKRATTKASKRPRFMSHRRRPDSDTSLANDGSPTRSSVGFQESQNSFAMRRPSGLARSVETIPESMDSKVYTNAALVL